jgi:hypothetical protein
MQGTIGDRAGEEGCQGRRQSRGVRAEEAVQVRRNGRGGGRAGKGTGEGNGRE